MSLMYVGRKNFDDNTINSIVMTDANVEFSDFTFYYSIAASQLNEEDSSYRGYFHEIKPKWKKNDNTISMFYIGMSPEFVNETGYIENNIYKELGIGFRKLWRINGSIINNFQIRFNTEYSGKWESFHNSLVDQRDSLEFFQSVYTRFSLFSSTSCGFWISKDKYFFEEEFYWTKWYDFHFSTRILSKLFLWGGAGMGYSIDYNFSRLGKEIRSWAGFNYSLFENLSLSVSSDIQLFYADTSGFARESDDILNTNRQWQTTNSNFSLSYTLTNEILISIKYQKINAVFADYYWDSDNNIDDDKFFGVIEYKPSPGNVIYFGGRLPEKMIFFKFSHRFAY